MLMYNSVISFINFIIYQNKN